MDPAHRRAIPTRNAQFNSAG